MTAGQNSKVVRDGKVAVLYSPGFGAGWYTWGGDGDQTRLFDPELVAAVESGDAAEQVRIAERKWPDAYLGGLPLSIDWVPQGERFEIDEYDGSESVRVLDAADWLVA